MFEFFISPSVKRVEKSDKEDVFGGAKEATKQDLKKLVEVAHKNGIRIVLDAVINHTGPVTETDTVFPESWVRTEPQCSYQDYATTVTCTLVKNLPDIRTESIENVALPAHLVEKWKAEGRYEQEVKELDNDTLRLVYDENPDKLELSYGKLVPILVKAIQELKEEVEILKSQNN